MNWQQELKEKIRTTRDDNVRMHLLAELDSKYFGRFDQVLGRALDGPTWLQRPDVAALVVEALQYRDSRVYELFAFCVMPNHVHVLAGVERSDASLYRILQSLKAFTACKCNKLLARQGAFWQHESYDHVIRDEAEFDRVVKYIVNNPVEAGLCREWRDWPWTYVKSDVLECTALSDM